MTKFQSVSIKINTNDEEVELPTLIFRNIDEAITHLKEFKKDLSKLEKEKKNYDK